MSDLNIETVTDIQTFPRDELQVVRSGRVIYQMTKPLFVWMRGRKWGQTKLHLLGVHGRSDCGHVDLREAGKLKHYRVSRQMPDNVLMCMHCDWYGQHRDYGA